MSDAFIVVLTAHQVTTLGVSQWLIADRDAGPETAWNVLVLQTVVGLAAFVGVYICRDSLGGFLHAPGMGRYVPWLIVAMFLERLGVVPERLLARQLHFRAIGLARTAGEIGYTVASIAMAFAGAGGMAIVWGNVLRSVLYLSIVVKATERRAWLVPTVPSYKLMKPALAYGLPLSVATFATFASRRWDNLIVSSLFGAGVVGQYNLAYNLADIPAVQVGEQIGDVLFPSFAQMEIEERKRELVRATGLLALIVFPLAVGLGSIASTLIRTLLKPEWQGVAPMLVLLSALSVVRPLGWTVSAYLQACKRPKSAMWLGLAKVTFLLLCLVTVGRLGPLWACAAVGLAFGLHSLAGMIVVERQDRVPLSSFLFRCLPPLLACVPLALAVLGVRHALDGHLANAALLILEIVAGAIGYGVGTLVFARKLATELVGLVKDSLGKRRATA